MQGERFATVVCVSVVPFQYGMEYTRAADVGDGGLSVEVVAGVTVILS